MDYAFDITVQPNTTRDNPLTVLEYLPFGTIYQMRYIFPSGCCGLVGFRIYHDEAQILPTRDDTWYRGSGTHFSVYEFHDLPEESNLIKFELYNEDDTYQHTVSIYISVLPALLSRIVNFLKRFIPGG